MVEEGPNLLFIGREADAQEAWPNVRQAWRSGKVLRVPQAYQGLAVLLKDERLSIVVVGVDQLSLAEISFFSVASQCRPKVRLLAFGKGDKLSNPRLDEAARHGAGELVSTEHLGQRLAQLAVQEQPRQRAKQFSQIVNLNLNPQIGRAVEAGPVESTPPQAKPDEQAGSKEPENFLAGRNVAVNRRKAPADDQPAKKELTTRDVVTPEELRVLLGEDGEEADSR